MDKIRVYCDILANYLPKCKGILFPLIITLQGGLIEIGGRGTYALGNNVKYTYQTVGKIDGVKVLKGMGNLHDLPVESHSSAAYIKVKPNGEFSMMRFYDKNHYLVKEIAYHPEKNGKTFYDVENEMTWVDW